MPRYRCAHAEGRRAKWSVVRAEAHTVWVGRRTILTSCAGVPIESVSPQVSRMYVPFRSGSADHNVPRRLTMLLLPLVGVGLLGFSMVLAVRSWRPRTYSLNMVVDQVINRRLLAERIAANTQRHGVTVTLSSKTFAALESLDLVDSPNPIDIALVAGGVSERAYPNVRQVIALGLEPMHLLVKPELAEEGVAHLRGKRINIGAPRSSCNALVRDLLRFAGMNPPEGGKGGDYIAEVQTPVDLSNRVNRLRGLSPADRERELKAFPDAIFILSPLPSLLAHDLVSVGGFKLQPLPFADAYCLDRITASELSDVKVDRSIFSATEIPAYTYGIDPPVPASSCRTIATRLILVSYEPTDAEAISRLVETIYDGSVAGLLSPQPIKSQVPLFPWHRGTELYLRKHQDLLTPEMLSSLGKLAGGIGAFASGVVALYGFLRLRQLRRFESYYHEIRRLELVARGQESDPSAPTDPTTRRIYLEDRLLDLKSQALQDFAEGGLKGEGLMSGIVSLVNDTRRSLERMTPEKSHQN